MVQLSISWASWAVQYKIIRKPLVLIVHYFSKQSCSKCRIYQYFTVRDYNVPHVKNKQKEHLFFLIFFLFLLQSSFLFKKQAYSVYVFFCFLSLLCFIKDINKWSQHMDTHSYYTYIWMVMCTEVSLCVYS